MKTHWPDKHSHPYWWTGRKYNQVLRKRKRITKSLRTYLQTKAHGTTKAEQYQGENTYAEALAEHYLTILRSEISGHGNSEVESVAAMASFAIVYTEMWAEANILIHQNKELLSHPLMVGYSGSERTKLLDPKAIREISAAQPENESIPDAHKSTYEFARLLTKTYCKALFELKSNIAVPEKVVVKHHASFLGDTLDELLELMQSVHPDNEPTELSLPKTHPNKVSRKTWLKQKKKK